MKTYTDLKQSVKLAEILPLDSADMYWSRCTITDFGDGKLKVSYSVEPCNISQTRHTKEDVPCWSLDSLLSLIQIEYYLEKTMLDQSGYFTYSMHDKYDDSIHTSECEEIIDCVVEMIFLLKKQEPSLFIIDMP